MANDPSSPGQPAPEPDGASSRWRISPRCFRLSGRVRDLWRSHVWVRRAGYAVGVLAALYVLVWITVLRTLPSADKLLTYQPPLPTMVRGSDGEIAAELCARAAGAAALCRLSGRPDPRLLAAEDKTVLQPWRVDLTGLLGAAVDHAVKFGSGERARGGSTITQQVAKNILIGNEYSVTRKLKEMILARRIESVLNKQQILELYLNEIPLGRQSFGVQAAARADFDKDVGRPEAARGGVPGDPAQGARDLRPRPKFAEQAIGAAQLMCSTRWSKNGWATPAAGRRGQGAAARAGAAPRPTTTRPMRADSSRKRAAS